MDKSVILMKSMPDKSQKWSDASNKFSKIRCKAVWVFPFVISTAWRILMKLDQSIDDDFITWGSRKYCMARDKRRILMAILENAGCL